MILPVNKKDLKWTGLRKYRMIDNGDGTISLEDVTEYTNWEESVSSAIDDVKVMDTANNLIRLITRDVTGAFPAYDDLQSGIAQKKTAFEAVEDDQRDAMAAKYNAVSALLTQSGSAATDQLFDIIAGKGADAHNAIYRGKDLGSAVTADQYDAIEAGTFEGLYIGDYWSIGNRIYRIAAFDYYLGTGDVPCTKHHVTLIPEVNLGSKKMNDTNTTAGGYAGSLMRTTNLEDGKTIIETAFGAEHILRYRNFLINAVTSGRPSGGAWYDCDIELMTEENVYGCKIYGSMNINAAIPVNGWIDKTQYPLFGFRPDLQILPARVYYWLRDVVSSAYFAFVNFTGLANCYNASNSNGVRPAFSIIKS